MCTDSLMRIIPTDTVVDDFFGFDAGQMHSGSLVWLFKPKQNRDSLFVAFRIKAKCKALADKLKRTSPMYLQFIKSCGCVLELHWQVSHIPNIPYRAHRMGMGYFLL